MSLVLLCAHCCLPFMWQRGDASSAGAVEDVDESSEEEGKEEAHGVTLVTSQVRVDSPPTIAQMGW